MGCPTEVIIGDNLVFSCTTHDPDTGILTDADAVPTYRIYEDETATAILTGDMAKLDDANTLGFYTELIACTVANGFEDGKTYTVYIEATVDGDTGGISYGFKASLGNAWIVEGVVTYKQWIRRLGAEAFGRSAGGGTTSVTFRNSTNSLNRITATVDETNNRTAVTYDDAD
jgi:hypothetical protein